jgi:hypothetical protein
MRAQLESAGKAGLVRCERLGAGAGRWCTWHEEMWLVLVLVLPTARAAGACTSIALLTEYARGR